MYTNTFLVDTIFVGRRIFLKSICVKTNSQTLKTYLLNNLNLLKSENILFSCYKFKIYDNIIIHYLGNDNDSFIEEISYFFANIVIELYEKHIIRTIISNNYFYFTPSEQKEIEKKCIDEIQFDGIFNRLNSIAISFYRYLCENKALIFEGFISFRTKSYIKFIDSIIDISVNKFIIDREYLEFIELLRTYISTKPSNSSLLHLIYEKQSSTILDENNNLIEPSNDIFNNKYLSDISFSSNDYALNTLLTLTPKKLIIHTLDEDDEFIQTLKLIFENRITICR